MVLMRELLPVVDDLERALVAAPEGTNVTSVVGDLELALNSMRNYLRTTK